MIVSNDQFSFQPPFYSMCVEHQAILTSLDSTQDWIDFDQLGLSEMPDVFIIGDKRFKYAGVGDGRGFYCEQELGS